jgi:hypothetical protein
VKHPARIAAAMAASAAIGLGAQAAPALAGGFSLNLAPQSAAVVGKPLIIQATGTVPPEDVWFPYWFSLDAIPTAVTTTCPADRWVGVQFAIDNGGAVVVLSQSEKPDSAGNFAIPVAVAPSAPGTVLLCGYTDDGEATTLAGASLMLDIKSAPSTPTTPPTPTTPSTPSGGGGGSRRPSPPEYARQGIRSCKALMSGADAKSCIRGIVRHANARCRRLHSRHSRTHCLKAVRRASKHAAGAEVSR